MKTTRASRRTVLKLAGGAGLAAAPLAGLLRSPSGRAAAAGAKRLLVIDMPNVVWRPDWLPQGGRFVDQGTGDARQFQYGPQAAFFEKIREHVTFIEGVPIARPGGDPHVAAQVHFMTGGVIPADGAEMSKFPSIDQILAQQSPVLSRGMAAPSVTWSAHTQGDGARAHIHIISFDQKLQPIFPQNSPYLAYGSLFSGFMPAATTAAQQAQLDLALKQNKSVLDFVSGSVTRLQARAPAAERTRLDSHMQGLRELEQRLQATSGAAPAASVKLPDPAGLQGLTLNDTAHHLQVVQGFLGLVKAAFAFDRTRVATLMFSSGHNWVTLNDYVPNLLQVGKVHELTHLSYTNKNQDMRLIAGWYGDLLTSFVADLAATPDVDGASLLDNTLIVFFSEVSIIGDGIDAQHSATNTPLAIIGGRALGHTGGRCLRYTNHTTNDLWAAVAPQFGVPMTAFGNPGDNHGPLPELFTPI
jgi:hypothetical protein